MAKQEDDDVEQWCLTAQVSQRRKPNLRQCMQQASKRKTKRNSRTKEPEKVEHGRSIRASARAQIMEAQS
jgi:hypothetical protein